MAQAGAGAGFGVLRGSLDAHSALNGAGVGHPVFVACPVIALSASVPTTPQERVGMGHSKGWWEPMSQKRDMGHPDGGS